MKKILWIPIILLTIIVIFEMCYIHIISTKIYVPISNILVSLDDMENRNCKKIEMQYEDLTSSSDGKTKELIITDNSEINQIQEQIFQTFCQQSTQQISSGSTNITIKLIFENDKKITINTCADGGFIYDNKYYKTNNYLGTFFSKYVLNT